MPRDLMHVELEGNLKVHLYGFLYMAVNKYKWFSLAQFNARVKAYEFGTARRPPAITSRQLLGRAGRLPKRNGSVVMNAGDMLQFAVNSLEILRPLLPAAARTSAEYAAWVAHIKYFQLLILRRFSDESISRLADLIYDAQTKFLAIQAYSLLWKPKNHFAQHFPLDIKRFGPLRGYWCMRFEAKNQEHKAAAKMGNYRDVPETVSNWWAYRSHLRLLRKRSATAIDEPEGTSLEVNKRKRYIRHPNLKVGMWVQIQRGSDQAICQVQSVAQDQISVRGFNAQQLHEGEDGPYIYVQTLHSLQSVWPLKWVKLTNPRIFIVPVLQSTDTDGKVRFVPQP